MYNSILNIKHIKRLHIRLIYLFVSFWFAHLFGILRYVIKAYDYDLIMITQEK